MKTILYLLMFSSVFYFSACGKKENSPEKEHIHDHSHSHTAADHDHENCDGNHQHEHADGSEHNHNEAEECDHNHDGHNHAHPTPGNETEKAGDDNIIVFSAEQAANVLDFRIEQVKPKTFYQILKTSGQILSAPGDEVQISATMSGIVEIANPKLVEGFAVNSGQQLFRISARNLSENNTSARLNEAKSILQNAKSEYERASELVKEKIISQREFLQVELNYEQAVLNYQTLSAGMSGNAKSITTPMNGFVKNVLVQPGQYVEIGQPLATVTQSRRLILRADVSQRYLSQAKNVHTASFTTPYDDKTYELSDLNGRLLSFGKSTDINTFYTPVNFEFDNKGDIIEGSFVEVYLKSLPVADAIVLPITALIEEQGHFFVFVQYDHDGEYIKKEVRLGASDGLNRQIIEGLSIGEKVVAHGAFAVKLASLSGAMPEHSHQH